MRRRQSDILLQCLELGVVKQILRIDADSGELLDIFERRRSCKFDQLRIFEKNGQLVYTNDNYGYNKWWNGEGIDGRMVETGTYWYALNIQGKALIKDFIFVKR